MFTIDAKKFAEHFTSASLLAENETELKDDMYRTALSINFLLLLDKIATNGPRNFIRTDFADCLSKGIITNHAFEDPVFRGMPFVDIQVENKQDRSLLYKDQKRYWPYKFKRLTLPDNWRLEAGCGCGHNMDPSSFNVMHGDKIIATVSYFAEEEFEPVI